MSAAVSGARDRLRPILLTTLTTVLGLAPLMYEESRQSLFLKPTVVTLVYGLSVGFFIVLTMIPALMVIQADVARALRSLRRIMIGHHGVRSAKMALGLAALAILAVNLVIFPPGCSAAVTLVPTDFGWGGMPDGLASFAVASIGQSRNRARLRPVRRAVPQGDAKAERVVKGTRAGWTVRQT